MRRNFDGLAWMLMVSAATSPAAAQDADASRRFWSDVPAAAQAAPNASVPARARRLKLDVRALRDYLQAVPMESRQAAGRPLALPLPEGGYARFSVLEAPVLEPALQQRFPEIRTYRGQGLDERGATIRFDLTPRGFHAQVLGERGTLVIDPSTPGDAEHYVVYDKRDAAPPGATFGCLADGEAASRAPADAALALPLGDTLRTYRLALAADGEYTATVCAPESPGVACALAALATGINRVTAIYERDLSVRLVLIAGEPQIIYTDPNTDPYTNGAPATMREQNQANLDAVIGTANYDIGHVFGTAGGGIAVIGGVCLGAHKGRAATGIANPAGDPFYVDYVSHEIGHHFGANHSFNGTSGFCGANRHASTAWEPGSGSTIMSYSGLCTTEDVQFLSDDVFHTGSLLEISTFLQGIGATCGAASATGNAIPTISAGPDVIVPAATPFTLDASGSDADGDATTITWDEIDLGAAGPPNTDNGNRPIFRSYAPAAAASRTFPRLPYILNNGNAPPLTPVSESLPTTSRSLRFQATIRDNRSGGGAVASDQVLVNVTASAGPFKVTAPDTAVTWTQGATQSVNWNVAGTVDPPVSCATVNLRLSADGGLSFPTLLVANTPNDGKEDVSVPEIATSAARVRVECATGPFFDVSNANFAISPAPVELQRWTVE